MITTKLTARLLMTMLVWTLSATAWSAGPYTGSRIFWDSETERIVFKQGGYARIRQLQDGRLMAVCENGGIKAAFSSDLGDTWSGTKIVASNTNNTPNCVPDLIQLGDGTIIVAYNPRPKAPYTADRHFGIRLKRSTDNGKTWGPEIFVYDANTTFEDGCWEPSLLELPSGELQLYFANEGPYTTSSEQEISLCRSFDGGQTWSKAEKVSFRAGFRDGMPVPVLLNDKKTIVVAIEDNGWGYGTFYPTTVRCDTQTNWKNYWTDASSPNRQKPFDYSICKGATGGAPYICVLPWGETVLSWQSDYEHSGKLSMMTAIGDANAQNFKAMQAPFNVPQDVECLWNSLCSIDTGIVVAVGGWQGQIHMIKGYPRSRLTASVCKAGAEGQPAGDGYAFDGKQIILGCDKGMRTAADFAYDNDALYFTVNVADADQVAKSNTSGDGIYLYIDTRKDPNGNISNGVWRIYSGIYGNNVSYQADNSHSWIRQDMAGIRTVISQHDTFYTIEGCIPWTGLGLESVPSGQEMRIHFAMQSVNTGSSTKTTIGIPDGSSGNPLTWMPLTLVPDDDSDAIQNHHYTDATCAEYDLCGRLTGSCHKGITITRTANGRTVKHLAR